MISYRVTRWFEGLQRDTVPADSLAEAVSLLQSAGDDISAFENGFPRPLTTAEKETADHLLRARVYINHALP